MEHARKSSDVYRLEMGDGSSILADFDRSIAEAALRMSRSLERGVTPDPADAIRVAAWLDEQDRKYGGFQDPPPEGWR